MKWVEIASKQETEQAEVIQKFLQMQGVENTFELWTPTGGEFPEQLKKGMAAFDAIRIGRPFRQEILEHFTSLNTNVRLLGAADCIVRDEKKWWPQASLYKGMLQIINSEKYALDIDAHALIVGTGAYANYAVGAAVSIGFKHIVLASKFDEQGHEFVKGLKRIYFSVDFQFVPQAELVMLPGNMELVINTTPLIPENELLNELYYFNFLKSSGLVIDLISVPLETPLITGAKNLGARFIRGVDILAQADINWMEWATGKTFDSKLYSKMLEEKFQTIPFDLKPYSSILEQNQMQKQTSV